MDNLIKLNRCMVVLFLALFCFCAAAIGAEDSADDNTGRDDTQVYHVFDDTDLVSMVKFQYHRHPKLLIKYVYPELHSDEIGENIITFNSLVSNMIDDEIDYFKKQVADAQSLSYQNNIPKSLLKKNELYIDYNTATVTSGHNHLISVRFDIEGMVGGMAHPYHKYDVLNFNLDTGKKIELSDLFKLDADYLSIFSRYTMERLFRRLTYRNFILTGTQATPENFKTWNLKAKGILITFQEAQVAPYAEGMQTVLIPYSVLKSVIVPTAPIAGCVQHPRRCSNSGNLLTGSFLDEG